jgi:hypothetical protein
MSWAKNHARLTQTAPPSSSGTTTELSVESSTNMRSTDRIGVFGVAVARLPGIPRSVAIGGRH